LVFFQIGAPEETKYHILVLSSLFTSAPLGREMTMNLARHVLAGAKGQEPIVTRLLNQTVLHFVPIMSDFEEVLSQYNAK
jgi:carboxypeptidase D